MSFGIGAEMSAGAQKKRWFPPCFQNGQEARVLIRDEGPFHNDWTDSQYTARMLRDE